jgi:DNA topoisomerase-6 subunit A
MAEKKHKKESKTTEKVSPKQIAERIGKTAESMVKQIDKQQDPEFTTMQRGKSNVVWDENKGYLALGEKEVKRTFLNIAHARKFMQTTLIMQKAQDYLLHNKTASIREIYYELKHTIKDTKENTFEGQDESDPIIVDLEHSVDTIREKLNLHANPKGTLYGNVTLLDRMHHNDKFNASKLGRGGWSIMSRVEPEEIELLETDAEYCLSAKLKHI